MNYVITESQLGRLIENQDLLNHILEKIKTNGIESLTDDEKELLDKLSRGEEVETIDDGDFDETSYYEFTDPMISFFNMVPNFEEVNVGEESYGVSVNEDEYGDSLIISGPETEIYIIPFWEGTGNIRIETIDGKILKMKSDVIPSDSKSMRNYIDNFYSNIIPKIINKLS